MNTIITIGRQYGSGGRFVGKKIAEHYGIKFWDNELLDRVAAESGYAREILEKQDEKPTNSFLFSLAMDSYSFGYHTPGLLEMPLSQKIFLAQYDVIRDIAKEGPAVFVGRCTDVALEDFPNVLNIFIHASDDFKYERISTLDAYPDIKNRDKALELCMKKDRQRQSYYNYYSSKKWGRADSYHLTVDTSMLGIEGTASMLIATIDAYEAVRDSRTE